MLDIPATRDAIDCASADGSAARLSLLWHHGSRPDLKQFLAEVGPLPPTELAAVVRIDQRHRWLIGDLIPAEAYLAAFPDLHTNPDLALSVILGEYLLRQEVGRKPTREAFQRRFPRYAEPLRSRIDSPAILDTWRSSTVESATKDPDCTATLSGPHWSRPRSASGLPSVPGYEVLEELGRGGMGVVYKARQRALNRLVALKMVLSGAHATPEQLDRFQAEALAVARLQHPNLVQIYEVGTLDGLPFFSLEYVDGGSLAQRLAHTPQAARSAAEVVRALAGAVQYAHERGVVHRDLKPANILLKKSEVRSQKTEGGSHSVGPSDSCLLSSDFFPKITDFGLAKQLDVESGQTRTGAVMGTPSYMAPEQAAGLTQALGPPVDVYALGGILYEMLTGRPPFRGINVYDTLDQVRTQEPVPPSQLVPNVPRDLETVCLKCLQKEPAKRYAQAADLAEDLRRFLDGEPIKARRTSVWERTLKWARRRPTAAALAIVSAVAAVAVVALAVGLLASNSKLTETNGQLTRANEDLSEQTKIAKKSTRLAEDRAVRLSVGNGTRLLNDGDLLGALPWFIAARNDDRHDPPEIEDARRAAIHRLRVESVLSQCPPLAHVWAFSEAASSALFSPDGGLIRVVLPDRLEVYETASGKPIVPALKGRFRSAEFLKGSRRMVLASDPKGDSRTSEIRFWDPDTNQFLSTRRFDGEVVQATPSPDGTRLLTVVSRIEEFKPPTRSTWYYETRVWNATTGDPVSPPLPRTNAIGGVSVNAGLAPVASFSPDGRRVLTRDESEIRVLDAVTGQPAFPPLRHSKGELLYHGDFSPDGRYIVTSGREDDTYSIRAWDAASGQMLHIIATGWIAEHIAFTSDSQFIAAVGGGPAGEAGVWNLATGRTNTLPWRVGGDHPRTAFSPDDRWLLVANKNGAVRVWSPWLSTPVTPPLSFADNLHSVSFSPNGRYLLGAGGDGTVRLWDLVPSQAMTFPALTLEPNGMARHRNWILPDGRVLTAQSISTNPESRVIRGEIRYWDGATGSGLGTVINVEGSCDEAALSDDGQRLAVTGSFGGLNVIDLPTGRIRFSRRVGSEVFAGLTFARDGRLLTVGTDGMGRARDPVTGTAAGSEVRYGESAHHAAFSADGRRVVTTSGLEEVLVQVWEVETGEPIGRPFRVSIDTLVELNADGSRLLTWNVAPSKTGSARLWEVATGQPITPPLTHRNTLAHAGLSPDGLLIVTADGFSIRVWDAANGEPITPTLGHEGVIDKVSFSAEGTSLWAVEQFDRSLRALRWDLTPFNLSPEDAELWGQVLCGQRVEGAGLVYLTAAELRDAWEKVTSRHPKLSSARAEDVVAWRKDSSASFARLGQSQALEGHWKEAAAAYVKVTELTPEALGNWKFRLRTQQAAGDLEGCRATCAAILDRFGNSNEVALLAELVWTCAMVPDGVVDGATLVRLIEKVAAQPGKHDLRLVRGLALYRAGRYDEAAEVLTKAEKARGPGTPAIYWCFLALLSQRQGRADEAKEWLDKVTRWVDSLPKGAWMARLEMKLLREEVDSLAAKKKR
jgi:serine/threonine protein kinase/WD40 repeat protein